ncbi:MAG: hypothetical protein KC503_29060 [Myxococcales bacterium]|nr:hypothetical protein [Myxococcales bacterium]
MAYRDDEQAQQVLSARLEARAAAAREALMRDEIALARRGLVRRRVHSRRVRALWVSGLLLVAGVSLVAHLAVTRPLAAASHARRVAAEQTLHQARARLSAVRAVVAEHQRLMRWVDAARERVALRMMTRDSRQPDWAWRVLGLWACLRDDHALFARAKAKLGPTGAVRLRADCSGLAPSAPRAKTP